MKSIDDQLGDLLKDNKSIQSALVLIKSLLVDNNCVNTEPNIEYSIDGISINWYRTKTNSALYFDYDPSKINSEGYAEYSFNLLKNNKVNTIINPTSNQILELARKFLND